MEDCTQITECIACGSHDLVLTLDLNDQPLANNFQQHGGVKDTDMWFPLAINRCQHCDHLQLTHAVNPELIYTHYLYVSGTSATLREYSEWYARFVREQFRHWTTTVLDIGCNDGTQLDCFKRLGYTTYGVDPAQNLFETSSKNHAVVCGFWNAEIASRYTNSLDIITTQNAFAHIPDPLEYLKLCKDCIKHDGKIFISTSQADMVVNGEFDTIYHEHISYYNAYSMKCLAERAGLYLIDVVKTPIHGTSYIFVLAKQPANEARIENILATETAARLHDPARYKEWSGGVAVLLGKLKDQLDTYRHYGYTIVGYGAAAKGMTLINASNIHLDCVIDDNPLKQGLYCPGTAIPVVSINWLDNLRNDETVVFVPLAWNFYKEIKKKILTKRNKPGDMFLRYFPEIKTTVNE